MVPPDSLRVSRARRYSGYCRPTSTFAYGSLTLYAAASQLLLLASVVPDGSPTTPPQKPGVVWAIPRSLAATEGVSFDFLSCGYLDVSVLRVGSTEVVTVKRPPGFPIRTSPDHCVLARSPRLFAGSYVLHRLLLPRHPPCALNCLITKVAPHLPSHAQGASTARHVVYPSIPNRIFKELKWRRSGSNRRPPACKAGALPVELRPLPEGMVGSG